MRAEARAKASSSRSKKVGSVLTGIPSDPPVIRVSEWLRRLPRRGLFTVAGGRDR